MSAVTVHLPGVLRPLAGGAAKVAVPVSGHATMADVLARLAELHPGVHARVVDERGAVRKHVNVFVGEESIRLTGVLATPVAPGDDVWVIPAVSGG
ncbi:MAG TPA: MoaD/ThiS family protein [Mycobacteriales bacterium]|nr:MoaD/ThiS family protein [Mycobacteriales bacterium]